MKEIIIREVRINHLKNAMGTGKKISVSWKLDGTRQEYPAAGIQAKTGSRRRTELVL